MNITMPTYERLVIVSTRTLIVRLPTDRNIGRKAYDYDSRVICVIFESNEDADTHESESYQSLTADIQAIIGSMCSTEEIMTTHNSIRAFNVVSDKASVVDATLDATNLAYKITLCVPCVVINENASWVFRWYYICALFASHADAMKHDEESYCKLEGRLMKIINDEYPLERTYENGKIAPYNNPLHFVTVVDARQ